jgi:anti-anti-sigma factor
VVIRRRETGRTVNEKLDISVSSGDPVVVAVAGKIMYDTHEPLLTALLILAERPSPAIVLDLADVPMCDSAGLNMLVQAERRARANGGWLRLANVQSMVKRVLTITNLDTILATYEDVAQAISAGDS